ncbi:MAG: alpha/beta fold hydrolase [Candidatus Levybacteria bacterium]|nr:alpha/beta fold hydrolase [Candidatus Levybacteria bacterium]
MKREVEFKVGRETLRGSLFVPKGKGPFPGVVFYHGRGSSRKRYLEISKRLSNKGIMALAFDFRGCGKSDGVFKNQTQRMGIDDSRASLEFLLSQNVDRKRIGIAGSSFGGFVAAILMSDFDFVKSLVFRAPAVYPNELLDTHVENIQDEYKKIKKGKWLDSVAYDGISNFRGKLLIIQSEKDEVVKSWVVQNYFDKAVRASKKELVIQKGAKHSLLDNKKLLGEFYDLMFDWFTKTL